MSKFKELWVWKEGIDLATEIYEITRTKPFSNDYGLCNQIQRAVVSIASNIAEGEERDTNRQSSYFFKIAKGSNAEVITQLYIAHKIGYIDEETLKKLEIQADKIGYGLYKLIKARGGYNLVHTLKWFIISLFIPI